MSVLFQYYSFNDIGEGSNGINYIVALSPLFFINTYYLVFQLTPVEKKIPANAGVSETKNKWKHQWLYFSIYNAYLIAASLLIFIASVQTAGKMGWGVGASISYPCTLASIMFRLNAEYSSFLTTECLFQFADLTFLICCRNERKGWGSERRGGEVAAFERVIITKITSSSPSKAMHLNKHEVALIWTSNLIT